MANKRYTVTATNADGEDTDINAADARELFRMAKKVKDAKDAADEAAHEADVAKAKLLEYMEELDLSKASVSDGEHKANSTLVRSVTKSYNEDRLKKRIGAPLWNKITTRKLDEKKLGAYVKAGDIDTSVVAEAITETPRKPYVKVTI